MNLKISAERGDGMLNYLEQGMILYVMAAVCVIGVISRFAANRCYKSLIRQSDNLAAAKDKQLQQMKTKYESIYRMNCGIKNTEAFVSKMQQQYRIAGTRLTSWENCSIYCAAAAFLIGAVSSLILYLNKGSVQNCVLVQTKIFLRHHLLTILKMCLLCEVQEICQMASVRSSQTSLCSQNARLLEAVRQLEHEVQ